MKSFYVRVLRPEISELLQKEAFGVGLTWGDCRQEIRHTHSKFLLFNPYDENNIIVRDSKSPLGYEQFTIEQVLSYFDSLKKPESSFDLAFEILEQSTKLTKLCEKLYQKSQD